MPRKTEPKYVAPLGFHFLTPYYDIIAALTIRERCFKLALIDQAQFEPGQQVLDLGCGTGTLAMWIKQRYPLTSLTGVDCDASILSIAVAKANHAKVPIQFAEARSSNLPYQDEVFDRVVSSLFFHHLPATEKETTIKEIFRILKPGAQLHIADWGRPTNHLMRLLFLQVQIFDGVKCTCDNVAGKIPSLLVDGGFTDVSERQTFNTFFGTMALYSAIKTDRSKQACR